MDGCFKVANAMELSALLTSLQYTRAFGSTYCTSLVMV